MANVALIDNTGAVNTGTRVAEALTADGHTVTRYNDDADLSTINPASFDLFMTAMTDLATVSAVATKLKEWSRQGKPIIVGGLLANSTIAQNLTNRLGVAMGLGGLEDMGGTGVNDPDVQATTAGNAHPILTGYTVGAEINTITDASGNGIGLKNDVRGSILATGRVGNHANDAMIVAVESGTELQNMFRAGNRIVYLGFLSTGADFTADGDTIIQRSATWALAGVAYSSPTLDVPKITAVAALDPADGKMNISRVLATVALQSPADKLTVSRVTGVAVLISEPVADSVLEVTPGVWAGSPTSIAYQWQTSADGETWSDVVGRTGTTYTVVSGDAGKYIRVRERATNEHGSTDAFATPLLAA